MIYNYLLIPTYIYIPYDQLSMFSGKLFLALHCTMGYVQDCDLREGAVWKPTYNHLRKRYRLKVLLP